MKVRTLKGQLIDMGALASKNANKLAIGNASMNARGDVVGPKGKILKKREEVVAEYNSTDPNAVKQVALRDINKEIFVSPAEAMAKARAKAQPEEQPTDALTPPPQRKRKIEDRE